MLTNLSVHMQENYSNCKKLLAVRMYSSRPINHCERMGHIVLFMLQRQEGTSEIIQSYKVLVQD